MKNKSTLYLTRGALIASLYFLFTLISSAVGMDKGVIQLRLSEALAVLPAFFPEAVLGLTLGCFISNLTLGALIWDTLFGSIATFIAALGTRLIWRALVSKHKKSLGVLLTLPPIISNALIIPLVLKYAYSAEGAYLFFALTVGLGELICAGLLGTFLYYYLLKNTSRFI